MGTTAPIDGSVHPRAHVPRTDDLAIFGEPPGQSFGKPSTMIGPITRSGTFLAEIPQVRFEASNHYGVEIARPHRDTAREPLRVTALMDGGTRARNIAARKDAVARTRPERAAIRSPYRPARNAPEASSCTVDLVASAKPAPILRRRPKTTRRGNLF